MAAKRKSSNRPPRAVRIGKIDTIGGVLAELGRVYREARRGELEAGKATKLAFVLREIRCLLEGVEMEARIRAIEEKLVRQ